MKFNPSVFLFLSIWIVQSCTLIQHPPKKYAVLKKSIWAIKEYNTAHGPGKNLWSADQVQADNEGIHFSIDTVNSEIVCSEINLTKYHGYKLGYGVYEIRLVGRLDSLQNNTVLGLFLYQKKRKNPLEIDIEFTKWNKDTNKRTNYSLHNFKGKSPQTITSNVDLSTNRSTHIIKWTPSVISFGTFPGHISYDSTLDKELTHFDIQTKRKLKNMKFHINFWKLPNSLPATESQEIILKKFKYIPLKKGE